jgi:acetyl esterase/lipase
MTVRDETIDDVLAAAVLLRRTKGVDPKRAFILGHSLGGFLVPRIALAAEPLGLAGFISMAGLTRPFIDAFRIALVEMVKWLETEYGFDRWEALQVMSPVGTAQVANVVDPNYMVVARFPKRFLSGK